MSSKLSLTLLFSFLLVFGQVSYGKTNTEQLSRTAVSANPAESAPAIAQLRAMGPAGLEVLFQAYSQEIERQVRNPLLGSTPEWQRLSAALDAVSQQKDSYLSQLYWYTDFGGAKSAAQSSGKPIISLRLLGKLDEEFSCANSRFFRTVLYSNAEVSKVLRERFILHWESVRPAPHVVIDFGDGRKLERTLTGNSIHYILDQDGQMLEALPGLYGPQAFLRSLEQIEKVFAETMKMDRSDRMLRLSAYHRSRLGAINAAWLDDIQTTGGTVPKGFTVVRDDNGSPAAIQIASLAVTKMVTEASILKSMIASGEALAGVTDQDAWTRIAMLHLSDAELDARSIGLIRRQTRRLVPEEGSEKAAEEILASLLKKLQMNIALDTVRNEYLMHTKLYTWLFGDRNRDVAALNKKVYSELFLTPAADPWLGLFSIDTYMALENGGIVR
ncbi:MAG TPA: hypothetical protein VJ124_05075 [Pyrinomonadaceae bacterium]|nr:hypothetical protein [Pyrinomonadaceae bacterium]